MDVFLYNYPLHFESNYLSSAKLYYIIHNEALKCSVNISKMYSEINTLNDIAEFSQHYKPQIYNNTIQSIIKSVESELDTKINDTSNTNYYESSSGNFELTFSSIINKYLEHSDINTINQLNANLAKNISKNPLHSEHGKFPTKEIINSISSNLSMNEVNLIFNSINHLNREIEISKEMKRLMNESANKSALKNSVYTDIECILTPIVHALEAASDNNFKMNYSSRDFYKAQDIILKFENNDYDDSEITRDLIELITLYPFDPKGYTICYYLLGDDNNDLEKLCNLLKIDIDFKTLKEGELNAKIFLGKDFNIIEKALKNNFFYKQTRDLLGKPLALLLKECKDLFNDKLQQGLLSSMDKPLNKFNDLVNLYGCFDISDENPLLIYYTKINNSSEDGFIITNKRMYFYSGPIVELSDLSKLQFEETGFIIDDVHLSCEYIYFDNYDLKELRKFIEFLSAIYPYHVSPSNPYRSEDTTKDLMLSLIYNHNSLSYAKKIINIFYDKNIHDFIKAYDNEPTIKRKFSNAIESYAPLSEGEEALLCFDNTALGSSRDGLLITNYGIHIHNSFSKQKKYLYSEIKSIKINNTTDFQLTINDSIVQTTMLNTELSKVRFCLILNRIREDFLILINNKMMHPGTNNILIANVSDLLTKAYELCSSNSIVSKNVFVFSDNAKITRKFENALTTYAKLEEYETPYLCYDDTLFGSAREGCVITNRGIHIHNAFSPKIRIYYSEIAMITLTGENLRNLFVNDTELLTSTLNTYESKSIFCKILNLFLNYFRNK